MQKSYEDIFQRKSDHIKPGLERMQAALTHLPQLKNHIAPSMLIGGTNGKGSTAVYLWNVLVKQGYRVGLYTSPHVVKFEERFVVNNQWATKGQILLMIEELRASLPNAVYEDLSFFEIATLIALLFFKENKTDVNVVEVGLGGRFDATNALDPVVSVITSIDLDHEEYLGSDLINIFKEKLGIARSKKPLILGSLKNLNQEKVQEIVAELNRSGVVVKRLEQDEREQASSESWFLEGEGKPKFLKFPRTWAAYPNFKKKAFLLALTAYREYLISQNNEEKNHHIDDQFIDFSAHNFELKYPNCYLGRFQHLELTVKSPELPQGKKASFILDVCHNPAGIKTLIAETRKSPWYLGVKRHGVLVSILRDKDYEAMLRLLASEFSPIVFFSCESPRALHLEKNNQSVLENLVVTENFTKALGVIQSQGFDQKSPVVICGSVYALGEVITAVNAYPESGFFKSLEPLLGEISL